MPTRCRSLAILLVTALATLVCRPADAVGCVSVGVQPNYSVGEAFSFHSPGRFRLTYLYTYSDASHFYFGETREAAIERGVAPTTLENVHTGIFEMDLPWRMTLQAEVPFVYIKQAREQGGASGTMTAAGLGDITVLAKKWIAEDNPIFRFYFGLGLRIPTGGSNEKFTSQTGNRITKDFAAQPGTGRFAGLVEAGGTSQLSDLFGLFWQARYIFTPASESPANNFRNELTGLGPEKNTDSDSANFKVGVSMPIVRKIREWMSTEEELPPIPALDGLAGLFAFQAAWVPFDDVFGATKGFRRSAIILFIEPGIIWQPRPDLSMSVSFPLVAYRKVQKAGGNLPEWVAQFSVTFTLD